MKSFSMRIHSTLVPAIAFLVAACFVGFLVWIGVRIGKADGEAAALTARTVPPIPQLSSYLSPADIRNRAAIQHLASFSWMSQPGGCVLPCQPNHFLLQDREVTLDGKPLSVLVFNSIDSKARCPACVQDVSLFEFRDEFSLVSERVAFGKFRLNAELATEDVAIRHLGERAYAVAFTLTSIDQGRKSTNLVVYRVDAETIDIALEETIGEQNETVAGKDDSSRLVNWQSTWSFVEVPNRDAEFVLIKRGVSEGRPVDEVVRFELRDKLYVDVRKYSGQIEKPLSAGSSPGGS